jgi:hypothetical protein
VLEGYGDRFEIVKLNSMEAIDHPQNIFGKSVTTKVQIDVSAVKFPRFNPIRIIDATGSKAHLMNGILKVPYSPIAYNHGVALIASWPAHRINADVKESHLHDCRAGSPCYKEGTSNTGLVSDSSEIIDKHLEAFGFPIYPDIPKKSGGNSQQLLKLLKDLDDPLVSELDKSEISKFFTMIKNAPMGLSGFEATDQLYKVKTESAKSLVNYFATAVLPNLPKHDPSYHKTWRSNLQEMKITFVSARIERHLDKIKVDNVPVKLIMGDKVVIERTVQALAIGDSLATTDFLKSVGTNRAFYMARQIFGLGKAPEVVFEELKRELFNSEELDNFEKTAKKWLLKSAKSPKIHM